jgi:hypothetical protein
MDGRPCPFCLGLNCPKCGEAERRQFRRMLTRLWGILTLWRTRFLPNFRSLSHPFIGTGLCFLKSGEFSFLFSTPVTAAYGQQPIAR